MKSSITVTGLDKSGLALVLISSVLLGIWASLNTIALRNALLWVGAPIALMYWWNWFKANKVNHVLPSLTGLYWLAVILIVLMFVWVVMHYFLFAQNPQQQLSELKSTWLRSLLAVIIGSATGLALNRSSRFMPWVWLGLLLSFIILIFQYIPKAIAKQSLFAVDWFGDYIYWAKFNGVLAGSILIAGLFGLLIDSMWQTSNKDKDKDKDKIINIINHINENSTSNFSINVEQKNTSYLSGELIKTRLISRIAMPIYVLMGVGIVTYSFIFIFDAKAGVAMVFTLTVFWLGIILFFNLSNRALEQDKKRRRAHFMKSLVVFCLVAASLSWFTTKHIKNNSGWDNLFEDMAIGLQIDKYQNWKDHSLGFPLRADGNSVAGSTYERVALGTLGMRLIALNPVGNGSFRSLRDDVKKIEPNYSGQPYAHSAWIDLGLSFGLPGLLFLPIALAALLLCAVINRRIHFRATIVLLAIAALILYLVGEYAFQHGVEILFYIAGLLCGLTFADYSKPNQDSHLVK